MNSPLETLIVDDESDVRQRLRVLLRAHPEIEVVGEAASVAQARAFLQDQTPALVFLDMEMPGGSGLELQPHLPKTTRTVFVTAYPDYAHNAFHFGAIDYLLKPVDPDRLAITIERLLERYSDAQAPVSEVIDCQGIAGHIVRFPLAEILWIESQQNYTLVYLRDDLQASLCRQTVAGWESLLPTDRFVRVGRSHIIHPANISTVRWTSRLRTDVSFLGTDQQLQLGRAAALRLKTHMKDIGTRGSVP